MTHEDFIGEVARRLEWPEEKTAGIIEVILALMSAELKMNNPVVIDDFGTLRTDIQPEYILVNPETKERHLMPPAVEVVFEALFQENAETPLLHAGFTPDEALYNDLNSSFSQFEPTPLNEGVQFPGIPEIVAEEPEEEIDAPEFPHPQEKESLLSEHSSQPEPEEDPEVEEPIEQRESVEFDVVAEDPGTTDLPEIIESTELTGQPKSPPPYRSSRRGVKSNKRTSPVWIPIAGGIAIIVASLFFFKGDMDGESGNDS